MPSESHAEAYEYDEDDYESDDEAFEYDDETFEADDDEAYEDDDEADEDDDEAYEAAYEDDDEGSEDDDEAYEDDDEGLGEAAELVFSRAMRTRQARARARVRAAAVARQRAAARSAKAIRANLSRQVKNIRVASKMRAGALRPVAGTAVVTAMLPNGRRTRMRISPAPASTNAVNRLRLQIVANDKRHAKALAANAGALKKLGAAQVAAVKKLTELQVKSEKALTKRILDGDTKLDTRITKELAKAGSGKEMRRMRRALKMQQRRSLWNGILMASSMPFFAAYGDQGDPFSRDNLILTGSLAGWMLGDEILDRVMGGGRGPKGRNSRLLSRGSDAWSYIAPVGNALTVYMLLKDRQHVRFLTDRATIDFNATGGVTSVPIALKIAEKDEKAFAEAADTIRAVATIVPTPGDDANLVGVTAKVERVTGQDKAQLVITPIFRGSGDSVGPAAVGKVTVAWMVDTKKPKTD